MDQLREMARTLGNNFERMRGYPYDLPGENKKEARVFKDVSDFGAALDVCVTDMPLENDTKDNARVALEEVKLKEVTIVEAGVEVPLWLEILSRGKPIDYFAVRSYHWRWPFVGEHVSGCGYRTPRRNKADSIGEGVSSICSPL